MGMAVVTLKKGEGRLLKSGGMWIFDNEIDTVMGNFENGDIVLVHDFDGYPMGRGFINTNSKITVRLMTRDENVDINEELLEKRVRDAWEYRKKVVDTGCCRLIFAEADFLPGIVVDKFSDVLVVQSLALGIDRFKETIVELLRKVLAEDGITIRGVYERSDVKVRKQEGMEMVKGFIGPEFPTLVQIEENGVKYEVDVKDGQKTGFFLDQKYNRLAIQKLCKNAKVLDCFTHTGSFALNAGIAGAASVTGVDASQLAVDQATANATLNGLSDNVKFICEDVFELLPELEEKGEKFDVVILDPPAFTKSRNSIKNAVKGYREINLRAMKLVKDGGFLATCSCSHFMDYELLEKAAMTKYEMSKKDPFRFFMRSIVAGLYLGLATILSYTLAVLLIGHHVIASKIAFAGAFGIGLVIIVLLGSELFTGNCFTTMFPVYHKRLRFIDLIPMWGICYIGNFVGIALICFLFIKSGVNHEAMNQYLASVVSNKLNFDYLELFIKGILCNFIVCAAAFVGMKLKEETAKTFIMMIIVMTFVLPGFEHSIANMGTFSMTFTALGTEISWSGVWLHMLLSTLGNIIGGSILLGLPIYLMIRPKKI